MILDYFYFDLRCFFSDFPYLFEYRAPEYKRRSHLYHNKEVLLYFLRVFIYLFKCSDGDITMILTIGELKSVV